MSERGSSNGEHQGALRPGRRLVAIGIIAFLYGAGVLTEKGLGSVINGAEEIESQAAHLLSTPMRWFANLSDQDTFSEGLNGYCKHAADGNRSVLLPDGTAAQVDERTSEAICRDGVVYRSESDTLLKALQREGR